MIMLLIILFFLSKTQSYLFLLQLDQQVVIKNYKKLLRKGFQRSNLELDIAIINILFVLGH